MTATSPKGARRDGSGRPSTPVAEPLRRVGEDFEDEYPGANALATECFANLYQAGDLLMELHNRQSREEYQLSPSARQILAVVEGAGEPLEPSVIAERVLVTTGTMTSVLDTLEKRGLVQRMPHPDDRRKLLVDITPDAQAILDELLPSLHARERDVISNALSTTSNASCSTSSPRCNTLRSRRGRRPSHMARPVDDRQRLNRRADPSAMGRHGPMWTAAPSGTTCAPGISPLPDARPLSSARGVHHLALLSSDVERTIAFYQDLLEFPLTELFENRDYQGSTHFFFDIGNGNLLAFFDFPGLDLGDYAELLGGMHHLAISVEPGRWEHLKGKLAAAGVSYQQMSGTSLYFSGPDGERLELICDPLGEMYGDAVL